MALERILTKFFNAVDTAESEMRDEDRYGSSPQTTDRFNTENLRSKRGLKAVVEKISDDIDAVLSGRDLWNH